MNEKKPLAVTRGVKHIKLFSTLTLIGLPCLSAYAADGSSTGIPGWVWLLIVLALLIGVTLLPKKWIEPPKNKPLDNKASTPTPVAKAPAPEVKPQPKAEVPSVVPQDPIEKTEPVSTPVVAPQVEAVKEVQPEKPIEVDALDEAKQLLTQQRYPQAVGILNKGLQKDPNRSDLMLELLEIYLKQGDHEAFDAQFEQLQKLDDPFALIQAEELHRQLERPVVIEESEALKIEESNTLEFDSSSAVIPEPKVTTPTHEYTTESLDFTSTKALPKEPVSETTTVTPVEHDFSLDEIDLQPTTSVEKENSTEAPAKADLDEFDFSAFDLNLTETPKAEKSEVAKPAPVELKVESPSLETKTETKLDTASLVDLDFNFDDSFTVDEDKQVVTKSEPSTSEASAQTSSPTLGEIIKGDDLSSLEEEFPFLQSVDTFQTRLDLARNYIALGEIDSARELLNEVAEQGGAAQQTEARELISKLAS